MPTPPDVIVKVMEASCYLLGMDLNPDELTDWSVCRKWLGKQGSVVFEMGKSFA